MPAPARLAAAASALAALLLQGCRQDGGQGLRASSTTPPFQAPRAWLEDVRVTLPGVTPPLLEPLTTSEAAQPATAQEGSSGRGGKSTTAGPTAAAVPARPAFNEGCSKDREDCRASGCCYQRGHRCFVKDDFYSTCMYNCTPGHVNPLDPPEKRTPWSCKVYQPACAAKGEGCRSQAGCCAGLSCFEKNTEWAACRPSCRPGVDPEEPVQFQSPWTCRKVDGTNTTSATSVTSSTVTATGTTVTSTTGTSSTSTTALEVLLMDATDEEERAVVTEAEKATLRFARPRLLGREAMAWHKNVVVTTTARPAVGLGIWSYAGLCSLGVYAACAGLLCCFPHLAPWRRGEGKEEGVCDWLSVAPSAEEADGQPRKEEADGQPRKEEAAGPLRAFLARFVCSERNLEMAERA